uniref:Secreted protein n=1 Tax=Anguilla anguilla TaxID=7936 RepID=A0A0E9REW8_ANGAN
MVFLVICVAVITQSTPSGQAVFSSRRNFRQAVPILLVSTVLRRKQRYIYFAATSVQNVNKSAIFHGLEIFYDDVQIV